jgi:hypothetical protein
VGRVLVEVCMNPRRQNIRAAWCAACMLTKLADIAKGSVTVDKKAFETSSLRGVGMGGLTGRS